MKKGFLVSVLSFLLLVGCSSKDITVISTEDAVQKINDKETFVLVVGSTTCHACQAYDTVLKEVKKNHKDLPLVKIYIDDEDPVTVEGQEEQVRVQFLELEELTTKMPSTPTTLFIQDGELVDSLIGNKEYSKIISKLETVGFFSK